MAEKVDPDDLIGAADVSALLGLSHANSVTTYLNRYPDFPKPVVELSGSRVRLWQRQDVERWHDQRDARPAISDEIVPGDRSGGTNTSHTIVVSALQRLLSLVDRNARQDVYERAVIEENVLGKDTAGSRQRTFRYLRELYLLRPDSILFRALRDVWTDDPRGQPLLAGLCALARDAVFRASAPAILGANPGDELTSRDLAEAVGSAFPTAYGESTLAKTGRNTFSSWEQTGHLEAIAKRDKIRRRPVCTPATTAYALLLGHLEGKRGAALFDTIWSRVLDQPRSHLIELAIVASQRSLVDFRHSAGVTEVSFTELLRPMEGQLL